METPLHLKALSVLELNEASTCYLSRSMSPSWLSINNWPHSLDPAHYWGKCRPGLWCREGRCWCPASDSVFPSISYPTLLLHLLCPALWSDIPPLQPSGLAHFIKNGNGWAATHLQQERSFSKNVEEFSCECRKSWPALSKGEWVHEGGNTGIQESFVEKFLGYMLTVE